MSDNNYFDAYLKDENDTLLEIGKASVSAENQSVDFISDFVPLMKFKSTATITKLIDGEECHRFTGIVYLSSSTRLQILDVKDNLISNKELFFPQKVSIKATVASSSLFSKSQPIDVEIYSLSMNKICFNAPKQCQFKQSLVLNCSGELNLENIGLSLDKQFDFSDETDVYYTTISKLSANSKKTLGAFLSKQLIIFP